MPNKTMNNLLSRRLLGISLLCILVGLLIAGLQPFNFNPKNDVHWFQTQNGIRFGGYGQVYGTGSLRDVTSNSNELTVELLVSSYKGRKASIESLVSVLRTNNEQGFAIEIWTIDLVVAGWFHNSATGQTAYDRLFCGQVFERKDDRFVTITSGSNGITVYVDGIPERSYPQLTLVPENFDGRLLLGEPAGGHQEWQGAIKGLAFYSEESSREQVAADFASWKQGRVERLSSNAPYSSVFSFHERQGSTIGNQGTMGGILHIPKFLIPMRPVVLKRPTTSDWEDRSDVILNLAGFVPLGILFVIYLRVARSYTGTRAVLTTFVIGFVTSVSIELLQVYLPSRDSSLLDVLMNCSGVLIGAGLGMIGIVLATRKESVL